MDTDSGEALRKIHTSEFCAAFKGMLPDGGHIIGDIYLVQVGAA